MSDLFFEDLDQFLDTHGMFNTPPEYVSSSELGQMVAMEQQAALEIEMPMQQDAASGHGLLPLMQQQAGSELERPMLQDTAPGHGLLPLMQQQAGSELETPMQQDAAPGHGLLPAMQQQAAPELVPPPIQQPAAPTLQPATRPPISMGVPSKELLKDLPFKVTVLLPKEKPKHYTYSKTFNLALVKPDKPFTMQFQYRRLPGNEPMFVRATPVFANHTQAEKRVETCKNHYDKLRPARGCEVLGRSVLQSWRRGPGVRQCGEPADPRSWFSVLVSAPGTRTQHSYEMKCSNTCFKNMTHRATEIIFTLENMWGRAYARQVMGLQSCSSPFRDLRRKLKSYATLRNRTETPSTERPRLLSTETMSIESPSDLESTDMSRIESAASDIETDEQQVDWLPADELHVEPLLPQDLVNSSAVALACMRCLTDDFVRDYGGDPRVVEICETYLNAGINLLHAILPP